MNKNSLLIFPANRRIVRAISPSYLKPDAKPNNQARQKSECITDSLLCPNRLLQGGQGHKAAKTYYSVS